MSEERLRIRATASSFHQRLLGLSKTNETEITVKKEHHNNTNKEVVKSSGRDFSVLKEDLPRNKHDKPLYKKDEPEPVKEVIEELPQKPVFTPDDFPTLNIPLTIKETTWVKDRTLDINPEYFNEVSIKINEQSRSKLDEQTYIDTQSKQAIIEEQEREARMYECIKKIKKQYEKDYVTHDEKDYLDDELQYYMDELDNSEERILYDEMLDETRNRNNQLDIELEDPEHYYIVYDEETPYYELDKEIDNPDYYFDKTDDDFFENDIDWYKIPENYIVY